ncbi:MAG: zinc ribbon domain-containing protein [Thermoproteota archaeon]|jgi:predicted nucleic-acid-binding Zn-ribbon protein|nr:zinc ribbon domain-containing protein [Thermoproteota archaeon]
MSSNRCPKCSSDLLQHPSLISLPLSSLPKNTASDKMKKNIEDQDAKFIFRFNSCKKCGYTEFYLTSGAAKI